jgi:hypothetical protein
MGTTPSLVFALVPIWPIDYKKTRSTPVTNMAKTSFFLTLKTDCLSLFAKKLFDN